MKRKYRAHLTFHGSGILNILIFFIFHFVCIGSAFAAEEAGHAFSLKDLIWPLVNFIILVAVLGFLLAKLDIKGFFKKRSEMIEKSMKDAEEAKELAMKTLSEVKDRLNHTDREIDEILQAARQAGEKEKEEIIAEGERLKNKIIEQAKANIDFELQKAKETIKSEAAILALELAEKQIKESLGKKEQNKLIDEYIEKLSK
jgi:F-type H+-transporting ATPase subunit b